MITQAKEKVATIKDNYSKWKVEALEDVARMKLRGKLETIDKAGLKDILGD